MPISPRSQSGITQTDAGDYLETKGNKVNIVGRKRARAVIGDNGIKAATQINDDSVETGTKDEVTPENTNSKLAEQKAKEQALSDELTAKVRDAAKKAAKGGTAVNRSMFN